MKIGIIGYGRMGRTVEQIAKYRNHEIASIIDINNTGEISNNVDCFIDFSLRDGVKKNVPMLCDLKIPVVIGATGWTGERDAFERMFKESGNTGIWSSNFSLGVNLYWQVIKEAVKSFDAFAKEYDITIHESHHRDKIDSPSGTAIKMAEIVLQNSSSKNTVVTEMLKRRREDNELHITSSRGGWVTGEHSIFFDSVFDSIEIKHSARTRESFAYGAVLAAEKIQTLQPGLYNFLDIFKKIFK